MMSYGYDPYGNYDDPYLSYDLNEIFAVGPHRRDTPDGVVFLPDYKVRHFAANAAAVWSLSDRDALRIYDVIVPGAELVGGVTSLNGWQCPAAAAGLQDLVGSFGTSFDERLFAEINFTGIVLIRVT